MFDMGMQIAVRVCGAMTDGNLKCLFRRFRYPSGGSRNLGHFSGPALSRWASAICVGWISRTRDVGQVTDTLDVAHALCIWRKRGNGLRCVQIHQPDTGAGTDGL